MWVSSFSIPFIEETTFPHCGCPSILVWEISWSFSQYPRPLQIKSFNSAGHLPYLLGLSAATWPLHSRVPTSHWMQGVLFSSSISYYLFWTSGNIHYRTVQEATAPFQLCISQKPINGISSGISWAIVRQQISKSYIIIYFSIPVSLNLWMPFSTA